MALGSLARPQPLALRRAASGVGIWIIGLLAISFFILRPIVVEGPVLRDFEAYYSAGAVWLHGGDPYSRQIWNVEQHIPGVNASRLELLPFVQPPIVLPLFAALSLLPYNEAAIVWGAFVVVCALWIAFGSFLLAGGKLDAGSVTSLLVFAAAYGPIAAGCGLGQATMPALAACIAALVFVKRELDRGSGRRFGFFAFVAAAFKPNVAVVLAALATGRRRVGIVLVSAAAFIAANVAFLGGLDRFGGYLKMLRAHGDAERFNVWQVTPATIFWNLGASPHAAVVAHVAIAAVAIAATAFAVIRLRCNPVYAFALACCALPFVAPFLHEQDLAVMVLPALLCIRNARGWRWSVAVVGCVLVAVDWIAFTQGTEGYVYCAVAVAVTALQSYALSHRGQRGFELAGLIAVATIALVDAHAANYQITLWPTALPDHFNVVANAGVAFVWQQEQIASGLQTPTFAWGIARLMVMAGALLLWLSMASLAARRGGAAAPAGA